MPPKNKLPAGPGRPKGMVNKTTAAIRDMIEGALHEAGGQDYLVARAKDQPVAFMGLVAKVMPAEIKMAATVTVNVIDYTNMPDDE